MTLTKLEISEYLFKSTTLNKCRSKEIVTLFFEEIKNTLMNGETVRFYGFGNFRLSQKRQRLGRNPKTGTIITINARKIVKFKPGKKLRRKIEVNYTEKS